MKRTAVLFDLGGVVLGSPLQAIRVYAQSLGFEANAIHRVVAQTAPSGAWSRLERGEIALERFYADFEADCLAARLRIDARAMMQAMAGSAEPRPIMLSAVALLRRAGWRTGALTNNWAHTNSHSDGHDSAAPDAAPGAEHDGTRALRGHFDVFVESSVEGLRKPDPAIYLLACQRLGVSPAQVIFLDDIGANLKPARALGMATIKVDEPRAALEALSCLVELDLLSSDLPSIPPENFPMR